MNPSHTPQDATLICELLDDCVFAETSATDGGLNSLRHIPGASLYGATAALMYPELKQAGQPEDIWQLFHANQVRFGNAYPLTAAFPAWPAPCTWQAEKNARLCDPDDHRLAVELVNASAKQPTRGTQRKPLRTQFVTPDGRFARPVTSLQLKTAFKPGKGTADEGQLFQYNALQGGQSFAAAISCSHSVPEALFERLLTRLDNAVLRVGRSKGAQYGRVRVRVVRQPANCWPLTDEWGLSNQQRPSISIWCVSDLCLLDEHLQPTTLARPEALGLPVGFQFSPAHSYTQTRRYSPYNSYRRSHDSERLVISAGSVLTFEWCDSHPPAHSLPQLRSQIGQWAGQHNGNGLGQVVVQPAWAVQAAIRAENLQATSPGLQKTTAQPHLPTAALSQHQTLWLQWVQQRAGQSEVHNHAAHWANSKLSQVRNICLSAATLVPGGLEATAPSASQWGRVLEACRKHPTNADDLRKALLASEGVLGGAGPDANSQNPSLRKKNMPWFHPAPYATQRFADGQQRSTTTLGDWLLDLTHDPAIAHCPGDALGRLASLCRRSTGSPGSSHTLPSFRAS
jgi:CRISPR-associated protein Csx10